MYQAIQYRIVCECMCLAIKKDCVETQRCYGKYDLILHKMSFIKL